MDTNNNGMMINGAHATVRDSHKRGGTLMNAAHQFASRAKDETFYTLDAMLAKTIADRRASVVANAHASSLRAEVQGGDVVLVGKSGAVASPTHYAFGQIASKVGAPAQYLRKLSPSTIATCLNEGLAARAAERDEDEPESLLFRREATGGLSLRALNTQSYKRVWYHEDVETLISLRERAPQWAAPVSFRSASRVAGTGAGQATWGTEGSHVLPVGFAGDRDCFVFLTDQQNVIEVDGASLFRGFFLEDSEVGAAARKLTLFLYDAACCNLIIWGVQNVREISMRHVGGIREAALGKDSPVLATLASYAQSSGNADAARIATAQRTLVADTREETITTLLGRRINGLTTDALEAAYTIVEETPRYGDPRSVWGIVNGLTEYSQRTPFADERIALDRAAGKVMQIAF